MVCFRVLDGIYANVPDGGAIIAQQALGFDRSAWSDIMLPCLLRSC